MAHISRGFRGRPRRDVDPSRVPPGQYLVEVASTADRTNVTGTAALTGTVHVLVGTYELLGMTNLSA